MSTPSDEPIDPMATRVSLLSRLRHASDHAGWKRFFDTYWRLLYNVTRRAGIPDAEAQDIVQETVIAVSRQMPDFEYDRKRGSFKGWLLTIIRRRISDHFRRNVYGRPGDADGHAAVDPADASCENRTTDGEFERIWTEEWTNQAMQLALSRVKEEVSALQFQMFHLHVLKELTVEEVTSRLGVKATAVYWAKYKVGRKLERALKEIEA